MSNYIFFTSERIPELRAEADEEFGEGLAKDVPGKPKHTDHMKTAGAEWKAMSDDEKAPYTEKAAKDKVRADREKKEYAENGGQGKGWYTKEDGSRSDANRPSTSKKTVSEPEDSEEEKPKVKKVRGKKGESKK